MFETDLFLDRGGQFLQHLLMFQKQSLDHIKVALNARKTLPVLYLEKNQHAARITIFLAHSLTWHSLIRRIRLHVLQPVDDFSVGVSTRVSRKSPPSAREG